MKQKQGCVIKRQLCKASRRFPGNKFQKTSFDNKCRVSYDENHKSVATTGEIKGFLERLLVSPT